MSLRATSRRRRDAVLWLASAAALPCAVAIAVAEAPPPRPDLASALPLATAQAPAINGSPASPEMSQVATPYAAPARTEDPLSNYQRTALRDWPAPAHGQRNDPWLRILLVAPKRPALIDLAVFIDGEPFRDAREAWIDGVLSGANAKTASPTALGLGDAAGDASGAKVQEAAKVLDVAAQARQRPTTRNRVRSYIAASVDAVDRDEVAWLLAEWGSGPAVVVLAPSASWQRANVAPLLTCLDADHDGALSAAEIAAADQALDRADFDDNGVVELRELRRAADQLAVTPVAAGHPLIVPLDDAVDWHALCADLGQIYDDHPTEGRRAASLAALDGATALQAWAAGAADATFRVDLGSNQPQPASLSLLSVGKDLVGANSSVASGGEALALDVDGDSVEFSAASGVEFFAAGGDDVAATQIAVGAVIDGNPLLRLIDADQDDRLSLRERQQLGGVLAALDRDGDGQVAAPEIPTPIRLAVTLGPQVHALLATPTGAVRAITPRDDPSAPAWFAGMDANGDRDLSRGEFLGTTEQFGQLDANADGLIGLEEAGSANIE